MDERKMMSIIESILFVSGDPISLKEISQILGLDLRLARKLMERMIDCFNFEMRGLQIIKVNDTFQLATRIEHAQYIEKFIGPDQKRKLSQASLEILAIISYRQPITRMDIEALRGVKSGHAISTLVEIGLIEEVGRMDAPGRPILYGTTNLFLRNFGLSSIKDLPPLKDSLNDL